MSEEQTTPDPSATADADASVADAATLVHDNKQTPNLAAPDAAAAAALLQAAPAPTHPAEAAASENRWSKNGYGEACPPPTNSGKFSKQESEIVRNAIEEYCTAKNITPARLCSECDHKAELKGSWMEIARQLPHRTVQSVYRHGLRQLHPFKRGPWAEEEVATLMDLVGRYGKKWSAIQSKLNRTADSCRDKHREMSCDFVKGRWKDNETECLKRLIREHLRTDPNADMLDLAKMVERDNIVLPWSTISKRMGKRSRLSCFKKWQKMTGLGDDSSKKGGAAAAGGGGGKSSSSAAAARSAQATSAKRGTTTRQTRGQSQPSPSAAAAVDASSTHPPPIEENAAASAAAVAAMTVTATTIGLTPNPIATAAAVEAGGGGAGAGADEDDATNARDAQIASELVEAVDIPVIQTTTPAKASALEEKVEEV